MSDRDIRSIDNIHSQKTCMVDQTDNSFAEAVKMEEAQRRRNEAFLAVFREDLAQSGLSAKTIKKHDANVTFFLTEYSVRTYYSDSMEDSASAVNSFLCWYIPEKYIGNTKNLIKENATSLRKFFKCMVRHGYLSEEIYRKISAEISEAVSDCGRDYAWFVKEFKQWN